MMMKKTLLVACAVCTLPVFGEQLIKKYTFDKHGESWYIPGGWNGKHARITDDTKSGKGALKLTATETKKGVWGCIVSQDFQNLNLSGRKFKLSFYAKGSGKLYPGFLISYTVGNNRSSYEASIPKEPMNLTGEWQKFEYEADLSNKALNTLSVRFEIKGAGEAKIDEVSFIDMADSSVKLKPETPHQVIADGSPIPELKFSGAKPSGDVNVLLHNRKYRFQRRIVKSDDKGAISWQGKALGAGLNQVTASQNGATAIVNVSVIPADKYAALDALAQKVKAAKPVSILYLGDSIADRDRSRNAVDKLSYWLNKYNPGKFTIENRAVSGDFITRVEQRLRGKNVWKANAYDEMWDREYDIIIVQLGNNDTMATTNDKFASCTVPAAKVAPAYGRVMNLIKENSNAKVILTSAIYPNTEWSKKAGERALAGKYFMPRFGMEEFVLPFNDAVKAFAAKNGAEYLDLYAPMKEAFKPGNYTDGVHLTEDGYTCMAEVMLKHFAK